MVTEASGTPRGPAPPWVLQQEERRVRSFVAWFGLRELEAIYLFMSDDDDSGDMFFHLHLLAFAVVWHRAQGYIQCFYFALKDAAGTSVVQSFHETSDIVSRDSLTARCSS